MCTQKFLQRHAITHIQTLLHAFLAQKMFNTQTPGLHKASFTKRTSYAQMLLHSETVVRRGFYTKKLTHRTKMPAYWAYCKRFSNSCSSLTATGTRQRDPPTGQRAPPTGQRDPPTGQRDPPTGQRDNRTTGQWDKGTTGQQELAHETQVHETTSVATIIDDDDDDDDDDEDKG